MVIRYSNYVNKSMGELFLWRPFESRADRWTVMCNPESQSRSVLSKVKVLWYNMTDNVIFGPTLLAWHIRQRYWKIIQDFTDWKF